MSTYFKQYTPVAVAGTVTEVYITDKGVGVVLTAEDGTVTKVKSYNAPRVAKLKEMNITVGQHGVLTIAQRKSDDKQFLFAFAQS